MVRAVGLEPTLLAEPDFESGASTNFTTPAAATYLPFRGCFAKREPGWLARDAGGAMSGQGPLWVEAV